ncbi:P-loop containing nucleoside triphosphate hydrolase protein [Cryphonectria parasitica EP155]|uniref:P-loop containing nucleoside triphosphate hydrolase protein n=1 Tax=Cryphonectria parasitica (strain ATCC 38755 / EP155) TaxID=660469 RepID=A0A9P4Y322_CRYP1|nr:P-loop containing nucleoside triphosphate hydrolase protein [Cryphonectria parasitica EP155]KAF3765641.1 P-loop containing nucleoside triphosphate hydrolase protein [Cryphonectria parasitica EP155]
MTLFDFFSNKRARRSLSPKAAERSLPSNDVDTRDTPLPERICIHSNDIVDTLLEICEGSVLVPPSDAIPVRRNITILRPFKLLVYHENRIRDFAERLEDKFAHLLKAGSNVAHGTTDNSGETARDHIDIGAGTSKAEAKDDRSSEDNNSLERFLEGRSPIALLHIRCLLNFMDKEINARKKHLRSSSCEKITFSDVWHLFQPGEEVIDQGHKQVYRVLHVQIPMHRASSPLSRYFRSERGNYEKPATVECIYIDFDGERLGPVTKTFEIPRFDQEKPIRSLPIYPFARDLEHGFRDSLVERGKKLWEVIQVRPMHYRGRTIDTREEIDSQVMVDFSEVLGHAEDYGKSWKPKVEFITRSSEDPETDASERLCASDCCEAQGIIADRSIDRKKTNNFIDSLIPTTLAERPSLIIYPQTLQEMLDVKSTPTEDELVLMSYRVFGFILRSRKWAELDLTHLEYDNEDNRNSVLNAFDSLILPDGHKDMVQSLVTQHFRDKRVREKHADNKTYTDMRTDLIRGKGQGLVMLLHGAPGVGKTTTAEGIAETFQKPLFQITCGDLGTTAAEVQVELEKNFTLASRWDCILLLDEAEVFLASRERKDLQRNALVAVFLRVLEYYTGILFLTTNRVGDFDEAFASRIQMSLHYPKLNRDKTERIFQINIKLIERKFREQKRNIMLDWDAIRAFALQHFDANDSIDKQGLRWNGRQIRNACQTALAMAEFEALEGDMSAEKEPSSHVHLKLKHFLTVEKA